MKMNGKPVKNRMLWFFRSAFLFTISFAAFASAILPMSTKDSTTLESQIVFHEIQSKAHPRSSALHANLASLYLEKLHLTGDKKLISKAQARIKQSLSIQPNLQAFVASARLLNYQHRFSEALIWAKQAQQVAPDDTAIAGIMMEAYINLGQSEKAEQLLKKYQHHNDFNMWATRAQWYAAIKNYDQAVAAFKEAGKVASSQDEIVQAQWALISQAGMYLDSGRATLAKPFLEQAQAINAEDRLLQQHWQEYYHAMAIK